MGGEVRGDLGGLRGYIIQMVLSENGAMFFERMEHMGLGSRGC